MHVRLSREGIFLRLEIKEKIGISDKQLRLMFLLATEHNLLRMFLNIWRQILFRETCMMLLFTSSVQLSVEPLIAHAVCSSQHA